jgi:hypothetical protein
MQCHSIFSFKYNLISTKSIDSFHQLMVIGSAQQLRVQSLSFLPF